jgi:predicted nucleotidyltransferase
LVPIDVLTRLEELEERIKQSSGLAASEVTEIKATIPRSNAVAPPLGVDPDRIADICRKHHVAELSLFGSAVRDDFDDESSDIDLLVDFEPTAQVGFIELGRLEEDLTLLFDRKVDLVPKAGLRPILREEVLASARVLYAA